MTNRKGVDAGPTIGRRDLLWAVGGAATAAAVGAAWRGPHGDPSSEIAQLKSKLNDALHREEGRRKSLAVLRAPVWTEIDLNDFLDGISGAGAASLEKALGITDATNRGRGEAQASSHEITEIKKALLWKSTNVLEYGFLDADNIQYHQLVRWVADKVGVHQEIIDSQSTFVIEHEICTKFFSGLWDKLSEEQRIALLTKIDPKGSAQDRAALASLSGSAALSALSAGVYFSGFAFYTSMSVALSSVAGLFGATLPFAAYTGASSLVAFLTGPVGWAIAATAAAAGLAMAGRANVRETTAAIMQIHLLKVAALAKIDSVPEDIFSVVWRVFPRAP